MTTTWDRPEPVPVNACQHHVVERWCIPNPEPAGAYRVAHQCRTCGEVFVLVSPVRWPEWERSGEHLPQSGMPPSDRLTGGPQPGKVVGVPNTTHQEMPMTLDELMNRILDVLLEHGGRFTSGTFGHTLIELAIEAHGEDFRIGDRRYGATSLAVIRLESYGFVEVERAYENRPGRANVIVEVALRE